MILPSGQPLISKAADTEIEGIILSSDSTLGSQLYQASSVPLSEEPGAWLIELREEELPEELTIKENEHTRLSAEAVKDLIIILHYTIT